MEEPAMERAVAAGATKLTYEDFLLFPDDGKRHEIVDGEHFVSAASNLRHQRVLGRLNDKLRRFVEEHELGEVFFAPVDVLLSRHDVVEPDLLFVSRRQAEILTEANVRGTPDLLVEVLSSSNRRYDEVRKRDAYERTGVQEYWIVDPDADTIKILRREGNGFARPLLLSAHDGDALSTPLLPGLELPLNAIFG
jgi:Uma2 family endonuclease